ncbi:MAG: diguanylate cyclase [Oscillospiraceae bacterium]
MKKAIRGHSSLAVKIAVGLTIFLGVCLIVIVNEKSFTRLVDDNIRNISKLSSATICAKIDDSLEGPIFVSQTMGNDVFLRDWLMEEERDGGQADVADMQRYLSEYTEEFGYDSAFLVSEKTGTYYHQDGRNKVITTEDAHDVWYYDFINSGKIYDLDVDRDEAREKDLTVFVNCRIEAEDGTLLGVVGVGVNMNKLQQLLQDHEGDYSVKVFLMDPSGLVQVDSLPGRIETANFFDDPKALAVKDRILGNKTGTELFWKAGHGSGYCLVSQYIEKLDWYLIVEKDAENMRTRFNAQMRGTLLITVIIIAVVLLVVSRMVGRYNRFLVRAASMDGVTGLPNNKMFRQIFNENAKRPGNGRGKLFIFDIDDFKGVNDTYGHMEGNAVLRRVARVAKATLDTRGTVARWGGDEFVGVVYGGRTETEALVRQMVQKISEISGLECKQITVSMGATALAENMNLSDLLHEADAAMYSAKERGKNQAVFFQDLDRT